MTTATRTAFDDLAIDLRESDLLGSTGQILDWDQETMMPEGGVEYRSRQLAILARMVAERDQSATRGELIAACEADSELLSDPVNAGVVREARRDYERAVRVPPRLVEELTKTSSIAKHEWAQARANSDFKRFQPWLEKLVALLSLHRSQSWVRSLARSARSLDASLLRRFTLQRHSYDDALRIELLE